MEKRNKGMSDKLMNEWKDEWKDEWKEERKNTRKDESMNKWKDEKVNKYKDWKDEWMNKWMDEWMFMNPTSFHECTKSMIRTSWMRMKMKPPTMPKYIQTLNIQNFVIYNCLFTFNSVHLVRLKALFT